MLKKIGKLEEALDQALGSFFQFLKRLTPKKLIASVITSKQRINQSPRSIFQFGKSLAKDGPQNLKNKFSTPVDLLKRFQQKISRFFELLSQQMKKVGPKQKVLILCFYLFYPLILLKKWMAQLSPNQMLFAICSTIVVGISSLNIILSGRQIIQEAENTRSPASTERPERVERPKYYKEHLRHLPVGQYKLPIYFNDIQEMHLLHIDLVLVTSNRQTRQFLEKYDYLVQNTLVMTIEPVVPSFPLEEEGKQIIKAKVRSEINLLLKEQKIEGKIKEVHIVDIFGI